MGHFHDTVRAIGKNRSEAEAIAYQEYLAEHGRRYDIRETESAVLVRKVPPMKWVEVLGRVQDHGVLRLPHLMPSGVEFAANPKGQLAS